jgi:hypothetical protein
MIDGFIAMTHRVITRDGFENLMPTLWLPERGDVRVLEGVPADADLNTVVSKWVIGVVTPTENYLVAFRTNATHFKVVARIAGEHRTAVCAGQPS